MHTADAKKSFEGDGWTMPTRGQASQSKKLRRKRKGFNRCCARINAFGGPSIRRNSGCSLRLQEDALSTVKFQFSNFQGMKQPTSTLPPFSFHPRGHACVGVGEKSGRVPRSGGTLGARPERPGLQAGAAQQGA